MNIQQMMKQAQRMQKQMQESQDELKQQEFEGTAGSGVVKVIIFGSGIVKSIAIDKNIIDPNEKDMIEDLLVVAFNDARKKLDAASDDSMNGVASGLKNFKLPF